MIPANVVREWTNLYETKGAEALVDATSGHTTNIYASDLWSGALTEVFGPCGLHSSWRDSNGRPNPEALEIPSVARAIEAARAKVKRTLSYLAYRAERAEAA